jgi:threonine aldolase
LRFLIKQRGAMLAKGMFLGAQFEALFDGELFFELARHANAMAARLRAAFAARGIGFLADSPTNQLFPILPLHVVEALEKRYEFHRWQTLDDGRIALRLVTSWATKVEVVEGFIAEVNSAFTHQEVT